MGLLIIGRTYSSFLPVMFVCAQINVTLYGFMIINQKHLKRSNTICT